MSRDLGPVRDALADAFAAEREIDRRFAEYLPTARWVAKHAASLDQARRAFADMTSDVNPDRDNTIRLLSEQWDGGEYFMTHAVAEMLKAQGQAA